MSNTYQEWEDDDDDFSQSQQSESDLLKQLRKESRKRKLNQNAFRNGRTTFFD
jgi:outer membrane protein TolC